MVPNALPNTNWIEAPDWIQELAAGMGVPEVTRFGVVPDLFNAATDGQGTVLIGEPLLRRLSPPHVRAIVAHELAHAAAPDSELGRVLRSLEVVNRLVVAFRAGSALRNAHPLLVIALWPQIEAWMALQARPAQICLNWAQECVVDSIAARHVGHDAFITALSALKAIQPAPDCASTSHPTIQLRMCVLAVDYLLASQKTGT